MDDVHVCYPIVPAANGSEFDEYVITTIQSQPAARNDDSLPEPSTTQGLKPTRRRVDILVEQKNLIGEGTFGSVYIAPMRYQNTEREICLKYGQLRYLIQENSILAIIEEKCGHQNIINRLFLCQTQSLEHTYMGFELFRGKDLSCWIDDAINGHIVFSDGMVLDMLEQITNALHFLLHTCNICHCDVTPRHLWFNGTVIKLIDFGQAFAHNDAIKEIKGTPEYMAPEILREIPQLPGIDTYGLGACGGNIITLRTPGHSLKSVEAIKVVERMKLLKGSASEAIKTAIIEEANRFARDHKAGSDKDIPTVVQAELRCEPVKIPTVVQAELLSEHALRHHEKIRFLVKEMLYYRPLDRPLHEHTIGRIKVIRQELGLVRSVNL